MAQQSLRKRRLEEKLGLNEDQTIKSGFDQETMAIVWDIMNKKYDGLLDHPLINYDEQSWPSWVFFLIVHDVHAAIWAVEEKDLKNLDVVAQEYLTPYNVGQCFRVVTWYMGSGLKAQNLIGIRAQRKGLRAQKNGIRDHKAFEPESGIIFITRSKNLLS